jgi:UDP-N-acetylglucosamine--N-acetylmuramyl-(pentapeptide) pyrophosphoryl-undecaprenol N-acetylglucosamine transferase
VTIVVTGGGTGGHIYPALAVAEALVKVRPDVGVVYIGAAGGMEERLVKERGISFTGVAARKLRRLASPDTLLTLAVLCRGWSQARRHLRRLAPASVLGTGGYVAAAAVLAASSLRVPIVLHEQNAIPGRTNRWLARRAQRVCVTFEDSLSAFPADRAVVTGLPIRDDVVAPVGRDEARRSLAIPTDSFMVLVLGGSQGAVAINRVVREALAALPQGVFVMHQTGAQDSETGPQANANRYRALAYLDAETLPLAYRAADLVVSRCGASTLAELAANGLPAVLVPYPAAYADHQTANARAVTSRGAGILLPQADLTPEALTAHITSLMNDRGKLAAMASASAALSRPHAAEDVARIVLGCARA